MIKKSRILATISDALFYVKILSFSSVNIGTHKVLIFRTLHRAAAVGKTDTSRD